MKKKRDKKLLKQKLRALCGSGEVVAVYLDADDPSLYQSGFVQAVEGKHFLMAEVADNGLAMGYAVFGLKMLFKIEYGSMYEEKERVLYALREQAHDAVETGGRSLVTDLLDYAKQHKLVVSLMQYDEADSNLRGFVRSVRKGVVELHMLDAFGRRNGVSLCKLDSISRVYCDGDEERTLRQLHAYHASREEGV